MGVTRKLEERFVNFGTKRGCKPSKVLILTNAHGQFKAPGERNPESALRR